MTDGFYESAPFLRFYFGFFVLVLAFAAAVFVLVWRSGQLRNTERIRSMPLLIIIPGDDEPGEPCGPAGAEDKGGQG